MTRRAVRRLQFSTRPTGFLGTACSCGKSESCSPSVRLWILRFAGAHPGSSSLIYPKPNRRCRCWLTDAVELVMSRLPLALALLVLTACGGRSSSPGLPLPAGSPLTNANRSLATDSLSMPPMSAADSELIAADSMAEGRVAADSAADEAVLEELAAAHP